VLRRRVIVRSVLHAVIAVVINSCRVQVSGAAAAAPPLMMMLHHKSSSTAGSTRRRRAAQLLDDERAWWSNADQFPTNFSAVVADNPPLPPPSLLTRPVAGVTVQPPAHRPGAAPAKVRFRSSHFC